MIRFINLFSKLSFKKNYDIIIIKKQYGLDARHLYALLSSNEKWSEILSRAHKLQVCQSCWLFSIADRLYNPPVPWVHSFSLALVYPTCIIPSYAGLFGRVEWCQAYFNVILCNVCFFFLLDLCQILTLFFL